MGRRGESPNLHSQFQNFEISKVLITFLESLFDATNAKIRFFRVSLGLERCGTVTVEEQMLSCELWSLEGCEERVFG